MRRSVAGKHINYKEGKIISMKTIIMIAVAVLALTMAVDCIAETYDCEVKEGGWRLHNDYVMDGNEIKRGCEVYIKNIMQIRDGKYVKGESALYRYCNDHRYVAERSPLSSFIKGEYDVACRTLVALGNHLEGNGENSYRKLIIQLTLPFTNAHGEFMPSICFLGLNYRQWREEFTIQELILMKYNIEVLQRIRGIPQSYKDFTSALFNGDVGAAKQSVMSISDEQVNNIYKKCEEVLYIKNGGQQ